MPYDHRHLRVFVAVAEELSFQRAALRAGLVQPAVSRTIRDLERRLEVPLLSRSTRHVRLTDAGRVFLDHARIILAEMEKAERLARAVEAGTHGRLTVAYMEFAVHRLLPAILPRFRNARPNVRVDLAYMWTERQRQAILEGEADIGFMIGPFGGPELHSFVVAQDPIYAVLPRGHPLAAQASVSLRELGSEPLVLGPHQYWSAFRHILADLFGTAGIAPRVVQEASTGPAILGMVGAGLGVSLYAGIPEQYSLSRVVLRPLSGPTKVVATCMVCRVGHRKPVIEAFVEIARSVAAQQLDEGLASARLGGKPRREEFIDPKLPN